MSSPYGQQSESDDKETVTYSKTKKQGDNTVTVSANADSMDELHDILKLAGITLPKGKIQKKNTTTKNMITMKNQNKASTQTICVMVAESLVMSVNVKTAINTVTKKAKRSQW
jgi:hypothetical protein